MNKRELLRLLEKFPDDIEIWVSDRGYCEGAVPLETVEKISAYDAPLDGDLVADEYYYVENMGETTIKELLEEGYLFSEDKEALYKDIILLNNE